MSHPGNDDPRTNGSEQPPTPSVTDWIPGQPPGESTPPPSSPSPFASGTDQPSAGGRPFAVAQGDPTTGQNPPVPVAQPAPAPPPPTPPPQYAAGPPTPAPQYAAGPPTMGQPPVGQPPVGQPPVGQPPVGQPYAPVPSPPTYDPAAVAQPYSAQPYSVQPYSVAPASGTYAYPPPGAVPKPRRTGVVVLSVLTTLFLLVAGVMTTMFVLTKQERDRLDGQVQRLGVETTDQRQKINTLQTDLDNTKRDLTDSQSETKQVADQKAKVSACVKAFRDLLDALERSNGQSNAETTRLNRAFATTCNEAERYLD